MNSIYNRLLIYFQSISFYSFLPQKLNVTDSFLLLKSTILESRVQYDSLRKKCPYSELFWSLFSRIRTNTERYGVYLRIQSKCGKIRTRITPNTDTFRAVTNIALHSYVSDRWDKVFKNRPNKICGREPLKNVGGCGLLKQTIYLQIF